MTPFYVDCPHCGFLVEILEVNCAIFRHGVYKSNGQQIPPHASRELCEDLIKRETIYGCGGPFQLVKDDKGEYHPKKCDYI